MQFASHQASVRGGVPAQARLPACLKCGSTGPFGARLRSMEDGSSLRKPAAVASKVAERVDVSFMLVSN